MKKKGFITDPESGDLVVKVARDASEQIQSGLIIDDVQLQNQASLIYMQPGELKELPCVGVGISSIIGSNDILGYKHKIREQLEADGFRINYFDIETEPNNKINIQLDATY